MNIVQIGVGRINPDSSNGVSRVIYYYNKYLKGMGFNVEVWGISDKVKSPSLFHRDETLDVHLFPSASQVVNELKNKRNDIDIVHLHMIWRSEKIRICNELQRLGIPYIISTHGGFSMLEGLSQRKKLAFNLYEKRIMNNAAAVHALTFEEMTDLKKLGIQSPIYVLPNGSEINVEESLINNSEYSQLKKKYDCYNDKIKILFLARGSYQKNPDGLVNAIALLSEDEKNKIVLFLAGPLDSKIKNKLYKCIKDNKLENIVIILGEVHGLEKDYLLRNSHIYCLPSRFEGLAVSMIEAMAYKKPCLITRTCCVSYFYKGNYFEMCEPWPEDISRGIKSILQRKQEWNIMGENAFDYYMKNFRWDAIVKKLSEQYKHVIAAGD